MSGTEKTVSMSEHEALQKRLALVEKENRQAKMSDTVKGLVQQGKILPAQSDKLVALMAELSDDQVAKFNEIMKDAKPVIALGEIGRGGSPESAGAAEDPKVMLSERVMKIMDEKKVNMSEATNLAYKQLKAEGVDIEVHGKKL